ncbi:MAG: mecR1 2, partial [Verrucomicrobiales bacterium]|nr:mecR1 2 [Verrucomicrobiales bacterium]
YQQDRIEEIPADYTLKLTPAVTIGGTVVDEQDAPVTDLRVVFSLSGPIPSRSRERVTMMGDYHTEMTDAAGHWSCNHVPPRFGMIAYRLVHPLFQEKLYACDSPDELGYVGIEKISEQDFLAQRALMRVKSGIIIAGTVTDENRQPIAGAKVTQGYDFHSSERNVLTEADGAFRFSNARPGDLSLTFQANVFAPEVISLQLSTNVVTLQIVLHAGRNLLGRVTDESGLPIRDARIEAASPTEDSRTLFEWHTKTGDDGRFSWDLAPASQDYAVEASGYQSLSHVTLVADGIEHIVRLTREGNPAVRILGQVLDAETRLPPGSSKIQIWETTREPGGGLSTFTTTAESLSADGQFRLSTSAGTISYILEAQAEGYSPKRITNEVSGSAEIQVTMELIKADPAAGIVLKPSGEAAARATLAVCGLQERVQMHEEGKLQLGAHSQVTGVIADAQGHFKLPAKYAADFVVVAHPSGFAELPLSTVGSNTTITLQPYGRIAGSVSLGGKALSGETIWLENLPWTRTGISLHLSARTADDGSFRFDSVPPGEWIVQREVNVRTEGQAGIHIAAYSHGVPVIVRSGETSRAELGGNGRPVLGKVIPPDPGAAVPWADYIVTLSLKVAASNAPQQPVRADFQSDEAFQTGQRDFAKLNLAFWTSEPGRTAQRLKRQYSVVFGTDGSFRIDDVPPGDYSLKIQPVNLPRKPAPNFSKVPTLASFKIDATIPVAPDGSDNSAVNLGDLQLSLPIPTQRVSSK